MTGKAAREHLADLRQARIQHRKVRRHLSEQTMKPSQHTHRSDECLQAVIVGPDATDMRSCSERTAAAPNHIFTFEGRHYLRYVDPQMRTPTSRSHLSKKRVLPPHDLNAIFVDRSKPEVLSHPPSQPIEANVYRRQFLTSAPCRLNNLPSQSVIGRGSDIHTHSLPALERSRTTSSQSENIS
jgi:hypothetical protein